MWLIYSRYTFQYPAKWKTAVINKVQKGTQGIDCMVFNTRGKGARGVHGASFTISQFLALARHLLGADVCPHACAGEQAFVITFGRAGEDNKSFRLNDIDSTLQGFAGADYDMQVAEHPAKRDIQAEEMVGASDRWLPQRISN